MNFFYVYMYIDVHTYIDLLVFYSILFRCTYVHNIAVLRNDLGVDQWTMVRLTACLFTKVLLL